MGLAGAVAVTASGWGLQAAALPPPKPAARIAADASVWFHDYRLAVDVFHFDHRRTRGACVRGWFPRRNGTQVRASFLSLRPLLRMSGQRTVSVIVAHRRRRFSPGLLAADAGCTGMLSHALVAAAQSGGHLTTERAYAANRPAIALELERGKKERLTLFVSPRTERPLVSFVDLEGRKITVRIQLRRVTRRVLTRYRLLHRVEPEPKR